MPHRSPIKQSGNKLNYASRPLVVAISDRCDAHLSYVEPHLDNPLVLIDPQDQLVGCELSYRLVANNIVVSYNGQVLDNVSGVWWRKPQNIAPADVPVPEEYKEYSQTAIQRHVDLLQTAFEGATWMSDYFALQRAKHKTLQMAVARRLGFHVPETIITSDRSVAETFIRTRAPCVTKSLTVSFPHTDDIYRVFFTTLIGPGAMPDLTNLHLAPAIFQQAIDAVCDVRVIVIGNRAFAASIRSEGTDPHSNIVDNRLGIYKGEGRQRIEAFDKQLPAELARRCIEHVRILGLRFGAIDLVVDKKGKYWFLENNPNGQWAFIEEKTGQPMGRSLAALLQGGEA